MNKNELKKRKQQIKDELAKIEELEASINAKLKQERQEMCLKNIGFLLLLVPDHDRTSCSDMTPDNPGDCRRCELLKAERTKYWPDDLDIIGVEFKFD